MSRATGPPTFFGLRNLALYRVLREDLAAGREAGADGIGICEFKLPGSGDDHPDSLGKLPPVEAVRRRRVTFYAPDRRAGIRLPSGFPHRPERV